MRCIVRRQERRKNGRWTVEEENLLNTENNPTRQCGNSMEALLLFSLLLPRWSKQLESQVRRMQIKWEAPLFWQQMERQLNPMDKIGSTSGCSDCSDDHGSSSAPLFCSSFFGFHGRVVASVDKATIGRDLLTAVLRPMICPFGLCRLYGEPHQLIQKSALWLEAFLALMLYV